MTQDNIDNPDMNDLDPKDVAVKVHTAWIKRMIASGHHAKADCDKGGCKDCVMTMKPFHMLGKIEQELRINNINWVFDAIREFSK